MQHPQQPAEDWSRVRLAMAIVGAAGGGALWGLAEYLPDVIDNARLLLFLFLLIGGFFIELLSLAGPIPLRRAVGPAVAVAGLVALLVTWASLRFAQLDPFMETGHPIAALLVIYLVATPFLSVRLEHGRAGWLDYAPLFQAAWGQIVRAIAAALFTSVFWGVLLLSDALLGLVNIQIIESILEIDPMPFVITGTVIGLALAVAHEWRAYVSPHLLLRLFRLLVPIVVPVLALFILTVALSGLEGTLSFFSETALLTGVAIGGITLVTVSVDRDADHQVTGRVMVWMVRILAVLLFPVALLALWGISARVMQYGWTPQRVLAALCVANITLYGACYAVLSLWRGAWMHRLRQANVGLALLTLVLSVLWLTPVLNAEALSARSQKQRILSGRIAAEKAALWELAHDWGNPGKAALIALQSTPDYPAKDQILAGIARVEQSENRWQFQRDRPDETHEAVTAKLQAILPVFPAGETLPDGALAGLPSYEIDRAFEGCNMPLPDGAPGCLFLWVDFRPELPDRQGILLYRSAAVRVEGLIYSMKDSELKTMGRFADLSTGYRFDLTLDSLQDIRAGAYEIKPATVNVLRLGGRSIFPEN